jgi:hypothetical protein
MVEGNRNRRRLKDKAAGDDRTTVEAPRRKNRDPADIFENFASPFPENRENSP